MCVYVFVCLYKCVYIYIMVLFDSSIVDHFTFTMTDVEGRFSFGFCRHAAGTQTCLCIIR